MNDVDRGLVERLSRLPRGSAQAQDLWQRVLERFRPAAMAAALAVLGNEAEAEDAVQDGNLKAWRGLDKLERPAAFPAWYLQVVRNAAQDRRRRLPRERSWSSLSAAEAGSSLSAADAGSSLSAADAGSDARLRPGSPPGRDPSSEAEAAERREWVARGLRALAERQADQAEVLYLRYRDDLSYAEMAELLGTTVTAVESRLFRARRSLAEWLERGSTT